MLKVVYCEIFDVGFFESVELRFDGLVVEIFLFLNEIVVFCDGILMFDFVSKVLWVW